MPEQRLWAPWRLEYIKGPKPDECIFCAKPAEGDDAATRIAHRGERCLVMLNTYPYNNGHVMVAPRSGRAAVQRTDHRQLGAARRSALTVERARVARAAGRAGESHAAGGGL